MHTDKRHYTNKKTKNKMNRKIFSFVIVMAMVVIGVSLISCGDDDDIKTSKAKVASDKAIAYVTSDMIANYDITLTIDGQSVAITESNTESAQYTSSNGSHEVRKYTSAKSFSTFPVTSSASLRCKLKDGKKFKELGKIDYLLSLQLDVNNDNNNTWSEYDNSLRNYTPHWGIRCADVNDNYIQRLKLEDATITAVASFKAADRVTVKYAE